MKPAAFRYHAPKTLDEAVATLAEVAPDDGRMLAGGQSLVPTMAFRLARPTHLIDINGIAALERSHVERQTRRSAPACAMRRSTGRWSRAAWRTACHGRASHRPPSDPHPRHLLRQPGACRPGIRMVPRRRDARCRDRRHQHARDAHDRGGRLLCRHHDDGARGGRIVDRGAAAAPAGGYPLRLLRIRPPRRRLRARHGARDLSARRPKIVEPRIGVGGAEATARRIPEAETALAGKVPGPDAFRAAAEAAAMAINPLEDHNTNADYRRDLVRALTRRALESAAA